MANYWISFTVKDEHRPKGTYDTRRNHIEIMTDVSDSDVTTWDETTSYILFPSPLDIDGIGKLIALGLDPDVDKFLIGQIGFKNERYWGAISYPHTLRSLYPTITQLV